MQIFTSKKEEVQQDHGCPAITTEDGCFSRKTDSTVITRIVRSLPDRYREKKTLPYPLSHLSTWKRVTTFLSKTRSAVILNCFPFAIIRGLPYDLGPTNPCLFANYKETFSTTALKAIESLQVVIGNLV